MKTRSEGVPQGRGYNALDENADAICLRERRRLLELSFHGREEICEATAAAGAFISSRCLPCLFRYVLHSPAQILAGLYRGPRRIVEFSEAAQRDFQIAVGRYVIMPDHVHLFVSGGFDFELGRWIGMLKQALAKAEPAISGKAGRIWQEGFFDHVLRNDESMAQKWEYILQNPVRAGLVTQTEDWPYQGEIVTIDRA